MKWFPVILISILFGATGFYVFERISQYKNTASAVNSQINFMEKLKITSSAFENGQPIPKKYSCDGEGISPPIYISGVRADAKSLALVVDDPDAKIAGGFTHWLKFNVPPANVRASEGADIGGIDGKNSSGEIGYVSPCPPSGSHRYFFKVYALDVELELLSGASKTDIEKAMEGHILDAAELMGTYSKTNQKSK
jgi:Raf kinase inhibitor-like YbhB/YbcL family protein